MEGTDTLWNRSIVILKKTQLQLIWSLSFKLAALVCHTLQTQKGTPNIGGSSGVGYRMLQESHGPPDTTTICKSNK